jgi:hypothetical protein
VTLIACGVLYVIFRPPAEQLIAPHRTASAARPWWATPAAVTVMRRDSDLLLLAGGAVALAIAGRAHSRYILVPLVWLGCAGVAIQMHRPVRSHHSLLLVFPAAWVGGVFIDAMLALREPARQWSSRAARTALSAFLILLPVWQCGKLVAATIRVFDTRMRREEGRLVADLKSRRAETRWMVTDLQIYPFAAGLVSPPELAVTSAKRRDTGALPGRTRAGRPGAISTGTSASGAI